METAIEVAAGIGKQHGKSAASWCLDGNTTTETYRRTLKGIEEGDPLILDSYNEPSLASEYASSGYKLRDLAADIGLDKDTDPNEPVLEEAQAAYLDAANQAFWDEIERVCRYQLENQP